MSNHAILIGMAALAALAVVPVGAVADTAKEHAIYGDGAHPGPGIHGSVTVAVAGRSRHSEGGQQLTSDEIAERFEGRTVTFIPAGGDKEVLVHYGADNALSGQLVGGDWSDTGYHAVTNDDRVCVSFETLDEGRLRCFDVRVVDGVVRKYMPDGSVYGDVVKFQDGKQF